jgi:hypothetical protein
MSPAILGGRIRNMRNSEDPMSQPEMQAFVTGLMEKWIASKK